MTLIGGKTVTGTVATGTKLPCMTEDCPWSAQVWVTIDDEPGVDRNGQPHGSRRVNTHVCVDCRDEMTQRGWRVMSW